MGSTPSSMPPWFASTKLTSPSMRQALGAIWADGPVANSGSEAGVVPGGGNSNSAFAPTASGTPTNPSITVAPGQAVVQNTGGTYICTLPSSVIVTIDLALPSAGQSRYDVLCVSVTDSEFTSSTLGTDTMNLITVAGTSAASPAVPSVPAGYLPLYTVLVTNAGGLTFTDVRTFTRGVGGIRFAQVGDIRAGSYPQDMRVFATGQVDCWLNLTGTWTWVTIIAPSVWTQLNAPWTYSGGAGGTVNFGAGGSAICRYKRSGNDLTVSYQAKYGTSPNGGTGTLSTLLPNGWTTPTGRDQWIAAHLYVNDSVSGYVGDYAGMALVGGSGGGNGGVLPFFPLNISTTQMNAHKIADTAGVPGHSVPQIGGGYAQGGLIHAFGTVEINS